MNIDELKSTFSDSHFVFHHSTACLTGDRVTVRRSYAHAREDSPSLYQPAPVGLRCGVVHHNLFVRVCADKTEEKLAKDSATYCHW